MTTSADLMDLTVAAIGNATDAGSRVFRPGDWPAQSGQYPLLRVRVVREAKQSLGRGGAPQFIVTTTIRIIGEVSAPAQVGDAGAAAAEAALWSLQRQIEVAVINSYPLTSTLQQISSIDSQLSYNSDAETHLAGIQIDIGMEFYQSPEDFAPVSSDALTEVNLQVPTFPGPPGFTVDFNE